MQRMSSGTVRALVCGFLLLTPLGMLLAQANNGSGASTQTLEVRKELDEARAQLVEVDAKIQNEQARWQIATDFLKKFDLGGVHRRVTQAQYRELLVARNTKAEVEQVAPKLKADKARLEAKIRLLETQSP
jgi:hypothetical protein